MSCIRKIKSKPLMVLILTEPENQARREAAVEI